MKWAILAALTLAPLPAPACMFAEYMRQTFFPTLPVALEQQPLVARVKVQRIRLYQPKNFGDRPMQAEVAVSSSHVVVEVLEGVHGVAKGDLLTVSAPGHSCADPISRIDVGSIWFIAGKIQGGLFHGSRSEADLGELM